MATITPEREEETLNPGQRHWNEEVGSGLADAEKDALQDIEDNYDQSADDSQENSNIDRLRGAESTRGQKKQDDGTKEKDNDKKKDKLSYTGDKSSLSKREKLGVNFIKKKGPLGLIATLLLSTGGIFAALTSPGLALVQIKEALMEDLNDSVAAMDGRYQHIFRAKMKNQTKGFCTKSVSVRCKYKNMSKKQVEKLRKQGISVEGRKTITGRYKVTKLSFVDPATGRPKDIDARNFRDTYNKNSHFRTKMNKFYSPRYSSIRDKAVDSVKKRFKLSFKRSVNGKSKAEMKRQYNSTVKDGAQDADGRKVRVVERDGKKIYVDDAGNEVTIKDNEGRTISADESESRLKKLKSSVGGGTKRALSSGLKGANTIGGTQAAICSVIKLLRMSGMASRTIKFEQLMRFAMPLVNTADSIKVGTATPEAVEYIGDMATHQDMRDLLLGDNSLPLDDDGNILDKIPTGSEDLIPTKNVHKGENAFDSAGLKASMYGQSSNLDIREGSASLSGGVGSKFVGIADKIAALAGNAFNMNQCAFWTNPIVQGAGLLISIGAMIGSGGSSVPLQVAKAVATTALTMFITNWLTNQITDMAEGKLFDADSQGLDAGNGWFTGAAAFSSASASSRGLNPLSSGDEVQQSQQQAMQTKQLYRETDMLAAQNTPFDVYNKYSFLGSIAWKFNPALIKSTGTVAGYLSMPMQLVSSMGSWLSPTAGAAVATDPSRYEKCADEVFTRINLRSADFMCNIRFGVSDNQLNSDPQKIVEWMIDSCQIDSESGELNKTGKCADGTERKDNEELAYAEDDTPNQITADRLLNSTPTQVAQAMKYDDTPDNADIAAQYKTSPTATLAASTDPQLPKSISTGVSNVWHGDEGSDEDKARRDVRTYAHFMRYCRFGPEEKSGRTVNIGDPDGEEKDGVIETALTGLDFEGDAYSSTAKECLVSNNCKPGQDPNDTKEGGQERALQVCRPPQYDIYAVYTNDKLIEDGMDSDDTSESKSDDDKSGLVSGEAKELAKKVAENENIEFVNPATKTALLKFADTGEATGECGQKMSINPLLSGVLLSNATKYKVKVNNFGFKEDRSGTGDCSNPTGFQHPKGNAVDLNGIQKIGGGSAGGDAWGALNYSTPEQVQIATDYATDWMDALATKDPKRGGVGQLGCGGFNIVKSKKPNWQGPDGTLHFDDSCNHLHIDVRDRTDTNKI